jgi:hypothetical protein
MTGYLYLPIETLNIPSLTGNLFCSKWFANPFANSNSEQYINNVEAKFLRKLE